MEIINALEIYDNIYMIKVPLPGNPLKILNSYLLKGKKRNLLIDTGFNMDQCYDTLKQNLDYLNVDMANTDIFFTHLHADHSGLMSRIMHEDTKIIMGKTDAEHMIYYQKMNDLRWEDLHDRFARAGYPPVELDSNRTRNPAFLYVSDINEDIFFIDDGYEFDLEGFNLKAIETPGHTPGHMCVYDTEKKILFAGDQLLFDITPNVADWPALKDSLGSYLESLKKIREIEADHVFVGHRKNDGDYKKRVDELLKHHEARLNEAVLIIEQNPGATCFEIAGKMTWSIRSKNWETFPPAQRWFAVGEAMAHLKHLVVTNRVKVSVDEVHNHYFPIN